MITFITAKAYHDISAALREKVICALKQGSQNIIYIVPDQFEYETEKSIYSLLRKNNMLAFSQKISVATFADISAEILRLCNEKKRPASDIVKNIIMQRVIRENKDKLNAFAGICEKQGFCAKMVQTITMLKTAGITPYELSEQAIDEKISSQNESRHSIKRYTIAAQKLRDVGLLYLEYNARLERDYLDRLDCTARAADLLSANAVNYFDNSDVFIDGFNDFTNSQLHFLRSVFSAALNVTLGFAADRTPQNEGRTELFTTINAQIDRLYSYAADIAAERQEAAPVFIAEGLTKKTSSPLLEEISEKIFSEEVCSNANNHELDIISAADSSQEMEFVAAKIKELTAAGEVRYSDIAVLCAQTDESIRNIETAFLRYEIPAFFDIPQPVLHQPLFALVTSLLDVLGDFSTERILSYIKTGFLQKQVTKIDENGKENINFVGLTSADINAFETFIYEWALTAQALKKPLTECVDSMGENERSQELYKCAAQNAEEVRIATVVPLLELKEKLSRQENKYGDKITELLFDFINDKIGISRAISSRTIITDNQGNKLPDPISVRSYQKLWDTLTEIFDALHSGLLGYPVNIQDYARIFREICSQATIAKPPQFIDTVLVGDIDRTRTPDVKAVFIVGASYDAFPSQTSAEGVFSEFEAQLIRESIVHIDSNNKKEYCLKSPREQYCLSLYRVYKALSLPSEYLCISCPEADAAGLEITRSEIIDRLLILTKKKQPDSTEAFSAGFYAQTIGAAKLMYSKLLFSPDSVSESIAQALRGAGEEEFIEKLLRLKKAHVYGTRRTISKKSARLIFPQKISATDIERLCQCRFNYFCERGLRIKERRQRTFNPIERGNAIHYVLEKILSEFSDRMQDFIALGRGELTLLVRERLAEYRTQRLAELIIDNARTDFLFKNLENAALDVLVLMQAEFCGRAYRPKLFETSLADENGEHTITYRTDDMQYFLSDALSDNSSSEKKLIVKPLEIETKRGKIQITGIIDRVDLFLAKDGTQYLRVVDYKTNNRSFSIPKALNGVNIQMLLYLFALYEANMNNPDKVNAGGVSYNPAKIAGALKEKLTAFELLAKNYKQSGMLVSDEATLEETTHYAAAILEKIKNEIAADTDPQREKEITKEDFMPSKENTIPQEGFKLLHDDCIEMLSSTLSELNLGSVSAVPIKYKDNGIRKACSNCRFASICGNVGEVREIDEKADISRYTLNNEEEEDE